MTDFRALCVELVDAFKDENTYTIRIELIDRARTALAESVASAERERSRISIDIDEMCEILRSLEIKATEYTDCTIRYEVTFDQLRAICETRAALAEQPVGATRKEAVDLYSEVMAAHDCQTLGEMAEHFARAVLARWGQPCKLPTPQPVPVSERWPEFSDCDPQERVWAWNPVLDHWKLSRINRSVHTHWLPANALLTPEAP